MSWATAGDGRRLPLDQGIADVTDRAYVLLEAAGGWRLALEVRIGDELELAGEAQEHGLDVRTSHLDTCPVRLERRRPRYRRDIDD